MDDETSLAIADDEYDPNRSDEYTQSDRPYSAALTPKQVAKIQKFEEWMNDLNQGRSREVLALTLQVKAVYLMWVNRVWRDKTLRASGLVSYTTLDGFIEELRHLGVGFVGTSKFGRTKFMGIVRNVDVCLKMGWSLEKSSQYAVEHPNDIEKLVEAGAAKLEIGTETTKAGHKRASYSLSLTPKGEVQLLKGGLVESLPEYMDTLANMPTSSESLATIRVDADVPSIYCSELLIYKSTTPLFDEATATRLAGEATITDSNGMTKYMFTMTFAGDTPENVLEAIARSVRAQFRLNGVYDGE